MAEEPQTIQESAAAVTVAKETTRPNKRALVDWWPARFSLHALVPRVETLRWVSGIYFLILGMSFLMLPQGTLGGWLRPMWIPGACLTVAGLFILWLAVVSLPKRMTVVLSTLFALPPLVISIAYLFLGFVSPAATLGLFTLGMLLSPLIPPAGTHDERRPDALGLVLGTVVAVQGIDILLGSRAAAVAPAALGIPAMAVGLVLLCSGCAVILTQLVATTPSVVRWSTHLACGGAVLALQAVTALLLDPLYWILGAASTVRGGATILLPWWSVRATRFDRTAFRPRVALALISAALLPMAIALPIVLSTFPEQSPAQAVARQVAFASTLLVMLLAGIGGWWLAGSLSAPLLSLMRGVNRIADGHPQTRLPRSGTSEIISLSEAVEQMAQALQIRIQQQTALYEQLSVQNLALQTLEQAFRRVAENALDIIVRFDRDLRYRYVNPAITRATGRAVDEFLDKTNQEAGMPEDVVVAWDRVLQQVFASGESTTLTFTFPSTAGPQVYQAQLVPEFDEQGQVVSVLAISRDITELSAAHQRTLQLLDLAHDAVLVRDPESCLLYWNQGAEQLYGWTAQEALGQITHLLLAIGFPLSQEAIEDSLAEHGQWEGVLEHRHRTGKPLLVESRQVLVRNAAGQPEAILEINRDITERERLRREREEARTRELAAQEAAQQMDAFLGIVSHELKTPLTTIKGNLQLATRQLRRLRAEAETQGDDGAEPMAGVLRLLGRAHQHVGVQTRLVNDLLDVSRVQADRLELRVSSYDVVQLVREAVEDQRLLAPTRRIELHTAVPDLPVFADAERVGQVIANFLTNALKYSEANQPVKVNVDIEGSMARVAVQDGGPGLARDQHPRIWEQFYQVPGIEVKSGSGVGLGLGLHICKQLIERQGGQVGVESAPGHGSTFWFTLPRAQP